MFSDLQSAAEKFLKASYNVDGSKVSWGLPKDAAMGDATTTVAMQLGKSLKVNPKEIAEKLVTEIKMLKSVEKAEVAGPGYVNVWLTTEALLKELNLSREAGSPKKADTKQAPVIVEYSQPNIAKPLGIHHIMTTIIGQAIANFYEHTGVHIIRVNHIGDWGTQFGKLAVAAKKWGSKPVKDCTIDELLALYVKFHEEAERDPTLEEAGRDAFRKLEQGDKELRSFWKDVVAITMQAMNALYERLHVQIEHAHGESMYEEMMAPILQEGLEKGVFKEGEKGAIVVEFPEELKLPTAVVQKGDSATIYMTRDFAQIRYRIDRWHPKAIYYVVDVAQSLHFQQLFATVKLLGWELPHLEHIMFGRMRFADKSMSTRKGNILKLEDVLDEAVKRADAVIEEHRDTIQTKDRRALAEMMGIGSVAYTVLSQNRKMDMVFDWGKMLSFEGNSAPYLQYTHARARSVLRKGEFAQADVDFSSLKISDFTTAERRLIRTLLLFPSVLSDALFSHMPHKVANFLYELAQDFNAFYNADPILKAQEPSRTFRLALASQTASLIKTGAELLTLRVPEYM